MTTTIRSIGLKGMEGYIVHVEVKIMTGIESMSIVGLPDTSVKESKERVLAALHSTYKERLNDKKIIINLSPAEQKKNGPFFDLAMAVGILKSIGIIKIQIEQDTAFIGALSLDGSIQPVEGVLPIILAAKKRGVTRLFCAPLEETYIQAIDGIELMFISSLQEAVDTLDGKPVSFSWELDKKVTVMDDVKTKSDFSSVIGHSIAKRALEISAAGEHNLLMSGPPGCGKSMLAECFPSILPSLSPNAKLEVMSIYQLAKQEYPHPLNAPPFRQPHHSSSSIAIIGGGSYPRPGEISLAHRGVLFLDEMAEFTKKTLDMLRQPLETGKVTISRAQSTVTYPARFMIIAATNPCPCGFLYSNSKYCICSPKQIQAYQRRISGPILDRMDILLSLRPVNIEHESRIRREGSMDIKKGVKLAREMQYVRYGNDMTNARISIDQLLNKSPLSPPQQKLLQLSSIKNKWSTRGQTKIIRLARTISDLAGEESISEESLWEAMSLRKEIFGEANSQNRGKGLI